tara:strand:- start:36 stop:371 length:336 start_codon:yes stop_codon:yes gene_type:complete
MIITNEIVLDLAKQELQSRIKPHWTKGHISVVHYQIKQGMLGLCRYCPNPVSSPESMRCDYHLEIKRKENIKFKKENRCHSCCIKLRAGMKGAYRCNACKEKHAISQRGYN